MRGLPERFVALAALATVACATPSQGQKRSGVGKAEMATSLPKTGPDEGVEKSPEKSPKVDRARKSTRRALGKVVAPKAAEEQESLVDQEGDLDLFKLPVVRCFLETYFVGQELHVLEVFPGSASNRFVVYTSSVQDFSDGPACEPGAALQVYEVDLEVAPDKSGIKLKEVRQLTTEQ